MKKQVFGSAHVPLSPAVRAGDFVFVSGQVPVDTEGNIVAGGIKEQTHQVLENVKAALALAGGPALTAPGGSSYTCAGGDIPSGQDSSVTVTGDCGIEVRAVIDVAGNLTVSTSWAAMSRSATSRASTRTPSPTRSCSSSRTGSAATSPA